MRTPAGTECPYFYGDYYRGRNNEECRLLPGPGREKTWSRDLCASCSVPEITRANSCEHQTLQATVKRSLFGLRRHVEVESFCSKCRCEVSNPFVGCGQCHPNLPFLQVEE
jgi:hypothetical protein